MPESNLDKKKLDKDSEPVYKDKKLDKVLFHREEVIEILKFMKGVQRRLQKKLE